ncbi:MAG: SDR family NAD(P)-dependent oxidoreductase, partial [bacterium]
MNLNNKVALVTGASSGIGKATAVLLAKEGSQVALLGREAAALQETEQEIASVGGECLLTPADVTHFEASRKAVEQTVARFGRLDILVNAAGIIATGSVANTSLAVWQEIMRVNLDAVFQMIQLALPHLEKTRGSIINVSSVAGLRAFPNILAYCVSKAGVDQLTRCVAVELAPKGIRVNAVNPGVVVTNLHRRSGMDDEKYAHFLEHSKTTHPLGRVGEPQEIAEA